MTTIGTEQALLHQMQKLAEAAGRQVDSVHQTNLNSGLNAGQFTEIFHQAIKGVSESENASSQMKVNYERGIPGVNLVDVMLASQKADLSFQAMVQVRNKVVSAYQEIMNMQI